MVCKKDYIIIFIILIGFIIIFFGLTFARTNILLSSSPFSQFENFMSDETGLYTDGTCIKSLLNTYGILDQLSIEIFNESSYDFKLCTTKMDSFMVGKKKVALFFIKQGHLHIYVMFSMTNKTWGSDGFVYQNELNEPQYRIEKSNDVEKYWLVLKHNVNHGLGLQLYDEVWYNPDGSIAAQYPLSGSITCFQLNMNNSIWAEYSSSPYFDGECTITMAYFIQFHYSYRKGFISTYLPVIREYWAYYIDKYKFEMIESDPSLPENFNITYYDATLEGDYSILGRYFNFYKRQLAYKNISSLAEWEEFIKIN